jgi:hypothetical protein
VDQRGCDKSGCGRPMVMERVTVLARHANVR